MGTPSLQFVSISGAFLFPIYCKLDRRVQMIRKLILVVSFLILLPVMANAGTIAIYVATAAVTGSISTGPVPPNAYLKSYTGYVTSAKTFTITANSGYTLAYIKNNTVNVPMMRCMSKGPRIQLLLC